MFVCLFIVCLSDNLGFMLLCEVALGDMYVCLHVLLSVCLITWGSCCSVKCCWKTCMYVCMHVYLFVSAWVHFAL